jgi:DNA repair protein RadC
MKQKESVKRQIRSPSFHIRSTEAAKGLFRGLHRPSASGSIGIFLDNGIGMSPVAIQPCHEILCIGANWLSDSKLIRLVVGEALSQAECEELAALLRLDPVARIELLREHEKGPRILAALELGKRALWHAQFSAPRALRSPKDVANYARPHLATAREQLLVFALDDELQIARLYRIQNGCPLSVAGSPAEILGPAMAMGSKRVICVHHHSSGLAKPSSSDLKSTARLSELADSLGLSLLDHVILGRRQMFSFWREGLLQCRDPRYC